MTDRKVTTLTNSDIIEIYLFWYVNSECKVKIMPLENVCTPAQSAFSQACLNTERSSDWDVTRSCGQDFFLTYIYIFFEKCEIWFKYVER